MKEGTVLRIDCKLLVIELRTLRERFLTLHLNRSLTVAVQLVHEEMNQYMKSFASDLSLLDPADKARQVDGR